MCVFEEKTLTPTLSHNGEGARRMTLDEMLAKEGMAINNGNGKKMTLDEMLKKEKSSKKPRKKAEQRECSLQVRCRRWFDKTYPELKLLLHHSPNEGVRTPAAGGIQKEMGMRAGFPDLILLLPGEYEGKQYGYLAIEMKEGKGTQKGSQSQYEEVMGKFGGLYKVIRTQEDFEELVTRYLEKHYGNYRKEDRACDGNPFKAL